MRYYVERTAQVFITFFGAMFLSYSLYRFMPGGPLETMISQQIQREIQRGRTPDVERIASTVERRAGINPEHGVVEGFYHYLYGVAVHQDFGRSIAFSEPVFDILFRGMPWSVFISGYGFLFGFTAVLLVGTLMAWKEGSPVDTGLTVFVLVMNSIPYVVGAVILLSVLSFQWGLFPEGGHYAPGIDPGFNLEFVTSVVHHAALPILSTFIIGFAGGSLGMRANTVRIMGSPYLRSAELRGLSTNRILTRYLTRNAILPIYTGAMISIAGIFSSNVVMEIIFAYPGVGFITLEAVLRRDYPLLMGVFIFFTSLTVIALLIADLTYGLIDPRAGSGSSRESF